ncbi:MAG: 3-phosphoshikimate 1-carboxyvinyltransferase [Bacteroidales bacterium]|nr:3-phosphoshikimate 1-carboxyvinyltransferase [Bacteroidales bacterium]
MTLRDGRVVRFGEIILPASKSESNRALMMAAYGGFTPDFQNLSDSSDTRILVKAISEIQSGNRVIDIADCGTAARFLTTFLACREGEWLLTGTERMKQRPIGALVHALMGLGVDIQCAGKKGSLPLRIKGKPISGGKVSVEMSQSSQFASSLLLAAPMWPHGIELELTGSLNSMPYLDMTLALMQHFGAKAERNGRTVYVAPKPYHSRNFVVSSDWSATSYWYEMAALCEDGEIVLRGHFARRFDRLVDLKSPVLESVGKSALEFVEKLESPQGDAIVAEWMKSLGVNTLSDKETLVLRKTSFDKKPLSFEFSLHPDLFPTMAAVCAGLQMEARFTGVSTLKLKESDRVETMREELSKIGAELNCLGGKELVLKPSEELPFHEKTTPLWFNSHDDHRVVMALAPLAMKIGAVAFDHPEVVGKSYPSFWSDARFLKQ